MLWSWSRPAAAALIPSLAQELTYAAHAAFKRKKKKKTKTKTEKHGVIWEKYGLASCLERE